MCKKWVILLLVFSLIFTSCTMETNVEKKNQEYGLLEDKTVYANDVVDSVKTVYVTVLPASGQQQKYAHTFKELNEDIDYQDNEQIEVEVLFQEGKDGGSIPGYFGYGLTDANGIMKLRGHSTRLTEQKSYKIKLNKKGGLWNGYEIINLNKHPLDLIRIRNKLSFDYLKTIPRLTSLRTQFVHLYIKDLSEGDYEQEYKDFGLYTHVENMDTDFLENHGLDKKGHLYKAENFEFFRYLEQLKLKSDDDYNEDIFEDVLEIKGYDNHEKLLHMLDDVNNEFMHINDIIEKHFDKENYITWLAVNILIGNLDTTSQNFYLYSPSDSNTWYFLPWDYDGAWGFYNQNGLKIDRIALWRDGVSNYWGVMLHRRFFKNRDNIEELNQKIESLTKIFTEKNTTTLLDKYKPIITYFLNREPDNQYYPWTMDNIDEEFKRLSRIITENRKNYYQSLERPMPVSMGKPVNHGEYFTFIWNESYDFQGDLIEYSIDISDTPDFENILYHNEGIRDTECIVNIKDLSPGKYYWRLLIKDIEGNIQTSFSMYINEYEKTYFGIQEFFIH